MKWKKRLKVEGRGVRRGRKWKKQKVTLAEVFRAKAFAKYFINFVRENCKRQMCPFALEEELSQKNWWKTESDIRERTISTSSRDSI